MLLSLQPFERPLPVYELKVQARDAVGACAHGTHGRDDRETRVRARQAYEATALGLERSPHGRASAAYVLGHSLLARGPAPLLVEDLDAHRQCHVQARPLRARRLAARLFRLRLTQLPEVVLRRDS